MTEVLTQDRDSDTVAQRIHHLLHGLPGAEPGAGAGHLDDRVLDPQRPLPRPARTSRSSFSRSR